MTKFEAIFELEDIKEKLVREYTSKASEKKSDYIKRKINAIDLAISFVNGKWLGGDENE